jgi:putative ABC transport system permease protein
MSLYEILGTLETGFIFGLVALGAYLTFKILDFPDLTVEGSFPLGAAVAATVIVGLGWNPWPATLFAGVIGFGAGFVTAFLNVRFNILHILSGILVAISLYSINLRIMSGPNKPLLGVDTVFTSFEGFGLPGYVINPIFLGVAVLLIKLGLDAFLATGWGISMRAAGANPAMAEANGVNVGNMKLFGVGLANALTAIAGALFAQIFGAADAYMGIGVIIVGLASVIVGMSILPSQMIWMATFACIFGAVLYRLAVALALNADFLGLQASDVQLVTAMLVMVALILQQSGTSFWKKKKKERDT